MKMINMVKVLRVMEFFNNGFYAMSNTGRYIDENEIDDTFRSIKEKYGYNRKEVMSVIKLLMMDRFIIDKGAFYRKEVKYLKFYLTKQGHEFYNNIMIK